MAKVLSVTEAVDVLLQGQIVGLPTETVYGLGADATNEEAIAKVFKAKNRPSFDPLIVHVPSLAAVREIAELSNDAEQLFLAFSPGPLTIVLPKKKTIPDLVTSGHAISLESKLGVTPFEWLWRAGEQGSSGLDALSTLDIDHSIPPVANVQGGRNTAVRMLREFLSNRLNRYHEDRNQVKNPATSGLSPWFHFGHLSTVEVVRRILDTNGWMPDLINASRRGARAGWWGLPEPVEAFLDQIITWRELGFNNAFHNPEHNDFNSLPNWAKITLSEHADDERTTYTLEQIRNADTHDEIWNAAQRQLVRKGIIHNYLRMLWGKRILEWAESPEQAAEWMIELNDTYALDGRDPNSYTGIFWVLGRHDRAWGPERAIFGKIRYMSSENTRRKFDLKPYLQEFGH